MNNPDMRPLNAALMEAVDFIQAEGWDRPATLFALVPSALIADAIELDETANPLSLVVQEDIPEHIRPGSEELGEFIATVRWPQGVVGAILAQEITFLNSAEGDGATPRAARLFSGIISDATDMPAAGASRSLIQLRPTEAELEADPFGQDKVELLGGDEIAPGVIATLESTFEED